MRAIPAILVAVSVTAISATPVRACDNDRYPCEPKITKPAADTRAAQKPAERKTAIRTSEEKAPPDNQRAPAKLKGASFWQPIDIPSQAVQPLEGKDAAKARDTVRVVSADEVNEIDLAALSVPDPVKIVPIRVMWPEAPPPMRPATQVVTAPPSPAPADTSLLERVMLTFGGAFGAASALRIFLG